jgi:hypothetical protein
MFLFVVLAASVAGCATHARQTGEGSALPRDVATDPVIDELLPEERDPSREWSVRDFIRPRGLLN